MSSKSMSRNTKWKLAIVAGISEYLVYAEAKYCAFEIHGEPKYYECPRTEYCCNFGCCVSPGFQIYHLWYYWLLVIIMFLVCSGGGWWYRYWLQGRYRAAASAIPTRTSSSRTQNPLRGPTCQAQQARITYNTARNTVLLHRMWKGPHRSTTSPAYSGAAAASSAHYQNTSVVLNDANCPYYQLYGPPPSYETVIAQTRGKLSSPSSPELMRSSHHSRTPVPSMPPPGLPPPPSGDPGFVTNQGFFNMPSRLAPGLETLQYQPGANASRIEGFDTSEYARLIMQQQYTTAEPTSGPTLTSPRHQQQLGESSLRKFYDRTSIVNTSKSLDNFDGENIATNDSQTNSSPDEGGFTVSRIDCIDNSCALDRSQQYYAPTGKFTSRIGVHAIARRETPKFDSPSSSQSELTTEPVATTSSSLAFESCSSSLLTYRAPSRLELRKIQGGSLKISRRREHQMKYYDTVRASRRLSSTDYEPTTSQSTTSRDNTAADVSCSDTQSNPSNNVILTANATSKNAVDISATATLSSVSRRDFVVDTEDEQNDYRYCQSQQYTRPPALSVAERSSTNSNLESKRKLDRSRSLE